MFLPFCIYFILLVDTGLPQSQDLGYNANFDPNAPLSPGSVWEQPPYAIIGSPLGAGVTPSINVGNPLRTTLYNETEARMLLALSAGAYGNEEDKVDCAKLSLGSMMPGIPDAHTILSSMKEDCDPLGNPCEGYIVASEMYRTLFVVFRGTKTNSQLILEGWSTLQPGIEFFGMGEVNSYFMNGHLLLWPDVENVFNSTQYQDYNVIFTGHSLGAALASLAAARTANMGLRRKNQIKVVTFGQPRTGSAEYAFKFDNLISYSYRVIFRMDIIPHMPACDKDDLGGTLSRQDSRPCDPTNLHKAYHHGTEIWYPESMNPGAQYIECTGLPKNEDFKCSDQYKFLIQNRNDYIWDHRHYFNVRVPEFGQVGCNISLPEGEIKLQFTKG